MLVPALACAALAGQLATVADQLLADHVTCLAHGERIHVDGGEAARTAAPWTAVGAATVAGAEERHAQCLFDDDVDVVPAPAPATLPPPRVVTARVAGSASCRALSRQPLYRLAPKNSPPV